MIWYFQMANYSPRKGKRVCSFPLANGNLCKGLALSYSNHCKHHSTDSPPQELITEQQNRYSPKSQTVRQRTNVFLSSPQLLDLRHEIALLQAWLQELMDAPVSNFEKQLQVIDRIERLVTNFQRIRLSAQALAQAEDKVRLVVNSTVLIIKELVTDKALRYAIAQRLAELGAQYEVERNAQAGLANVLMQAPGNGNANAPIDNAVLIRPGANASAQALAAARETGDPTPGTETDQDIGSPSQLAPSLDVPGSPSQLAPPNGTPDNSGGGI